MKKLKLSLSHFDNTEVLTREQLKNVLGGDEGSGVSGNCSYYYTSTNPGYGTVVGSTNVGGSGCTQQIAACNQYCVDIVVSGEGIDCHYDAQCDN